MKPEEIKPGTYKVSVTSEDITHGIRKNGIACPIALALQRTFGTKDIHVEDSHLCIGSTEGFLLPRKEADNFIAMFDQGNIVLPMEFTLNLDWIEPSYDAEYYDAEY